MQLFSRFNLLTLYDFGAQKNPLFHNKINILMYIKMVLAPPKDHLSHIS
jgi:hypothetical protein